MKRTFRFTAVFPRLYHAVCDVYAVRTIRTARLPRITRAAAVLAAAAITGVLVSCASSRGDGEETFHNGFYETALSNGIPVILKQDAGAPQNPGGTGQAPRAAVTIMLRHDDLGSAAPYVRTLMNTVFADLTAQEICRVSVFPDYSAVSFSCAVTDVQELLYSVASAFLSPDLSTPAPVLPPPAYDDASRFARQVRLALYKDHPYAAFVPDSDAGHDEQEGAAQAAGGTSEIEVCWRRMCNARRVYVVACGAWTWETAASFTVRCESLLKNIPSEPIAEGIPAPPAVQTGATVRIALSDDAGQGMRRFAAGCFPVPRYTDDGYAAFAMACMYLTDTLQHMLVERDELAAAAGVGMWEGAAALGVLSVTGLTQNFEQVRAAVNECLLDIPETDEVQQLLTGYKRDYIRALRGAAFSPDRECRRICESIICLGSPQAYTRRAQLVNSITAGQIIDAYRRYFSPDVIRWYVAE